MTTDSRQPSAAMPIAVTLLVLLGAYVAGYFFTVEPEYVLTSTTGAGGTWTSTRGRPVHRHPWLDLVFRAIHRLDRFVRPNLWPTDVAWEPP